MNKLIVILTILSFPVFSQNNSVQKFQLSPSESKAIWKGENFAGAGRHEGTIQLTSGYLLILNNETVKGELELDMTSIKNADQKDVFSNLKEGILSDDVQISLDLVFKEK